MKHLWGRGLSFKFLVMGQLAPSSKEAAYAYDRVSQQQSYIVSHAHTDK